MIKIGRKFLHPHRCPGCHKLIILVRHPLSTHCDKCRRLRRRKKRDKYKSNWRRRKEKALTNQGYCALCGSTKDLTCHHAVNVRTGEWRGGHVTVLCEKCHKVWEQKVQLLREMLKKEK